MNGKVKELKIRNLPDVMYFQEGPGVRKWQFRDKGVKLLNGGNINNGTLDLSSTKIHISEEEAYGKYKHFLVDEGDLVIASSGVLVDNFHNKIAFVKKEQLPLCMNTSTIRFKTLNKKDVNINYFRFFLKTDLFKKQIGRLITGSAQLNFGPSHLEKIKIPLPPIDDQIRIADILSRAESLIAKRKETIKMLDEYLKSVFLDMFGDPVRNEKGWERVTIRDLIIEAKYGTSKSANDGEGKFKYIRMNNVTSKGYWDFTNLKYIDVDEKEKNKYILKKNDLVFNRTNSKELVGKSAVYTGAEEVVIAGYLIRVRTNENANPWYIWGYLNSKAGKFRLFNLCRNIVGMANINAQELQNIEILKPPVKLQDKFAAIIEKVEHLKLKYIENLMMNENVYNVLVQRVFKDTNKLSGM